MRFPELFAGHARDEQHPFPRNLPRCLLASGMVGFGAHYAIARASGYIRLCAKQLLFVDPCLPEWLPEIKLEKLHVGQATVSLRVFQTKNGCAVEILDLQGKLNVIHRPLVWSDITRMKRFGDAA